MPKTKEEVAGLLRERINGGVYLPGSRLPIRLDLEREFATSSNTMQRALDQLIAEGYVVARRRTGSFVSETPPNLSKICVFLPFSLSRALSRNIFYRSMIEELPAAGKLLGVTYEVLDSADNPRNWGRVETLLEDVRLKRIAGIIFLAVPAFFTGTPLYDAPGVARVAISSEPLHNIPAVTVDFDGFYRRAFEHLAAAGRRRPAVMVDHMTRHRPEEPFTPLLRALGMESHPELFQVPSLEDLVYYRNLLRLWRALPENLRPDSLVVSDDFLLAGIGEILREMNWLCAPPSVVALTNFPWTPKSDFPFTLLGFEIGRTLEICTQSILRQTRGETVPARTILPPLFEHERTATSFSKENLL